MIPIESFFSALDYIQLGTGVIDVISDVLVIADFREASHRDDAHLTHANKFFWICLFLFVAGSIIGFCMFAMALESRKFPSGTWPERTIVPLVKWVTRKDTYELLRFLLVMALALPFAALLCPPLMFILNNFYPDPELERLHRERAEAARKVAVAANQQLPVADVDDGRHDGRAQDAAAEQALASRDVAAIASAQFTLSSGLDAAVVKRRLTMFMSNVSAVAGSLPQCAVQLFAISISNAPPSRIQQWSLLLSLAGLLLHAPQVCRSFRSSAFLAKITFLAYDLLSGAFICSVIFASSSVTSALADGDLVSSSFKLFVTGTICCIVFFGALFLLLEAALQGNKWPWQSLENAAIWVFGAFVVAGVAFPVVVLALLIRFSMYLLLCLVFSGEDRAGDTRASMVYEWLFCRGERNKLKHGAQMTDFAATFARIEKFVEDEACYLCAYSQRSAVVNSNNNNSNNAKGAWSRRAVRQQQLSSSPSMQAVLKELFSNRERKEAQIFSSLRQSHSDDHDAFRTNNLSNDDDHANEPEQRKRRKQLQKIRTEPDSFLARVRFAVLCNAARVTLENRQAGWRVLGNAVTIKRRNDPTQLQQQQQQQLDGQYKHATQRKRIQSFVSEPLSWSKFFMCVLLDLQEIDFAGGWGTIKKQIIASDWDTRFRGGAVILIFVLFGMTALTGLLFPVAHLFWHGFLFRREGAGTFSVYNELQSTLLTGALVALLVSILFIPSAIRYLVTLMVMAGYDVAVGMRFIDDIVNEYNSVPVTFLRTSGALPDAVVPADVLDQHVLAFLTNKHVGLFGLSDSQFEYVVRSKV